MEPRAEEVVVECVFKSTTLKTNSGARTAEHPKKWEGWDSKIWVTRCRSQKVGGLQPPQAPRLRGACGDCVFSKTHHVPVWIVASRFCCFIHPVVVNSCNCYFLLLIKRNLGTEYKIGDWRITKSEGVAWRKTWGHQQLYGAGQLASVNSCLECYCGL